METRATQGTLPWLRKVLSGFLWILMLRLISATWRKHYSGIDELDRRYDNDQKTIVVLWHGKYFTLLPLLRYRDACVFTSLSARGDVIVDLQKRLGFRGVQIPVSGHELSMDIMRQSLTVGTMAAIVVDGPLGPYHVVHHGAIQLASELDYAILPVSAFSTHKRVLSRCQNKFEVPRLFSHVHVVAGQAIRIPANLDNAGRDEWVIRVHDALEQADRQAQTMSGIQMAEQH